MNDKTLKRKSSSHYAVFDLIEEMLLSKEKTKTKYHNNQTKTNIHYFMPREKTKQKKF